MAGQVFEGFFTVIFPAEDRGVRKQQDADGNDVAAGRTYKLFKSRDGQGDTFQRGAVGSRGSQHAGGSDDQTGDGADHDGIEERTGHVDVTLTNGVVRMSRCRGDSRGTHTGFIGEAAAGYAEADRVHDADGNGTQYAAAYCFGAESHNKNLIQAVGDSA